ncbi:MAG: glycosyltransferase [bacterium]|nr:glycosyltransferase [bacterium]
MRLIFNGGLFGKEALCYQGREIVKQLSKNNTIKLDCQEVDGYWKQFYNTFSEEEDFYIMNGHVTYLPELVKKGHKNLISICVFETELPQEWITSLNIPEVKQIWTVSEFCKDLIIKSGVDKPVKVIYLGIDERFKKINGTMFPGDKSFKFLNVSAPHCRGKRDRKGLDILIKTFKREFKDDPNFTLILKINPIYADQFYGKHGMQFDLNAYIRTLIPKGMSPCNISIITTYYDMDKLNGLLNSIDCGVQPSRGEGFGLPEVEMMKIGKPVITTDYSAQAEFSDPILRVKVKEMKALDGNYHPYYTSLFAEPDWQHLRKIMRKVHEKYDEEKQLAEMHADTLDHLTWWKVGERMEAALEELK